MKWIDLFYSEELSGGRFNEWIIALKGFLHWLNDSLLTVDKIHSHMLFYQRLQASVCSGLCGGKTHSPGWNKGVSVDQTSADSHLFYAVSFQISFISICPVCEKETVIIMQIDFIRM